MKNGIRLAILLALGWAVSIAPVAMAIDATPVPELIGDPIEVVQPTMGGDDLYQGTLRIIMSEPTSRYTDLNNDKYAFGMLDWAGPTQTLNIADGGLYSYQVQWDASVNGFGGVYPDNFVAQAVVAEGTPYTQYADPPSGNAFFAYWVNAAAQASVDLPGQDFKSVDFTHTVYVEELTQKY